MDRMLDEKTTAREHKYWLECQQLCVEFRLMGGPIAMPLAVATAQDIMWPGINDTTVRMRLMGMCGEEFEGLVFNRVKVGARLFVYVDVLRDIL